MRKFWIIVASILLVAGVVLFGVFIGVNNGIDFKNLKPTNYKTNTYEFADEITDIDVKIETADISITPSNDGKTKVVCNESEKVAHKVFVEKGSLKVTVEDNRTWIDNFLSFTTHSITIYLPKTEYNSIKIENVTGDVEVSSAFTFKNINVDVTTSDVLICAKATDGIKIKSTTGDVTVLNVNSNVIEVKLTSGDVYFKNVIANEKIAINSTTGDVELEGCDALDIYLKTTTGDVEASLLSGKIFDVNVTTGEVRVPSNFEGGKCKVETTTGDVEIVVK